MAESESRRLPAAPRRLRCERASPVVVGGATAVALRETQGSSQSITEAPHATGMTRADGRAAAGKSSVLLYRPQLKQLNGSITSECRRYQAIYA